MNFEAGLQKLNDETAKIDSEAVKQLEALFDDGCFTQLDKFAMNENEPCECVTAYGTVCGVMTFAFSGAKGANGAMGKNMAQKIGKVYSLAEKVGAPVVGIYNSDGAHIDEGIDAMEAFASLIAAASKLSGVVPQISVIAGDCVGSAAVLATTADVVIMKNDAELYVTAGSILADEKVGSAELAAKNGTAAIIAETDEEIYNKVAEVITFLPQNNLVAPVVGEYYPASGNIASTDAYEVIEGIADADSFLELYKGYAEKAIVGFARINGAATAIVATNSEKLDAAAASKIARFVRFSDAFSIPVVTLLNSYGVLGNKEDELSGGVKYASQLAHAYAEATTAKITVITGAAVGGAYIALASKAAGIDSVFAWPSAFISALEPKTAVELLMKDKLAEGESREDLANAYCDDEASAFAAANKGYIEDVISPMETAPRLALDLEMLSSKRVSTLNKKHSNIQL